MKDDIKELLENKYIKILRIFPKEDTFIIEKSDSNKRVINSLSVWVNEFINNGYVYPDDIPSFIKFFNSMEVGNTYCYRRKFNDSWHWVLMELARSSNGDIIMLVREISNDLLDLVGIRREWDKNV